MCRHVDGMALDGSGLGRVADAQQEFSLSVNHHPLQAGVKLWPAEAMWP